jgi:hypothetical protein
MHQCGSIHHPRGYLAHRYGCPVLAQHPGLPAQCDHARFVTGGCKTDSNAERGGLLRLILDRSSPWYRAIYCQRTSAERINSQAKELGIERPRVRNRRSVERLNTLTYLLINAKALQRARQINHSLLAWE